MKLKVQSINRHRFTTDGKGITTLIGLYGCPLKCKYCLNKNVLNTNKFKEFTPIELVEQVMIDYCYFVATEGGITFGGGEPLIYSEQIKEIREILPNNIKLNIETSLNVDNEYVSNVLNIADEIFIDIKSMNNEIYEEYTGNSNSKTLQWLKYIVDNNLQHKCTIRIPNIPNYTTKYDIEYSIKIIEEMGFKNIDTFDYVIRD